MCIRDSATTGDTVLRNVQPLYADFEFGGLAVGHNGNLTNATALRRALVRRGCLFQLSLIHICRESWISSGWRARRRRRRGRRPASRNSTGCWAADWCPARRCCWPATPASANRRCCCRPPPRWHCLLYTSWYLDANPDVAAAAGMSPYEILTSLGRRYARIWHG